MQIVSFHFLVSSPSQNAPGRVDSCSSLQDVVAALSDDVTFTGCYRCAAELQSDANGIYRPCYSCLPITAVRRYYRYLNAPHSCSTLLQVPERTTQLSDAITGT